MKPIFKVTFSFFYNELSYVVVHFQHILEFKLLVVGVAGHGFLCSFHASCLQLFICPVPPLLNFHLLANLCTVLHCIADSKF